MSFYTHMAGHSNASLNRGLPIGGWKELGRTTLGTAAAQISVSSLPDKLYYMAIIHTIINGTAQIVGWRFNNDSGNNYFRRRTSNGAADVASSSVSYMEGNSAGGDSFCIKYIANYNGEEGIGYSWSSTHPTNGNTDIHFHEDAGKWKTTSTINEIISHKIVGSDYGVNTQLIVLGYDPDDTHTDGVWEELGYTELGTSGDDLDITSFSARQYLMWQAYLIPTGGTISTNCTFNNDATTDYYQQRDSENNGTNTSRLGRENFFLRNTALSNPQFYWGFICNDSDQEKHGFFHGVDRDSTGATNNPTRCNSAIKWRNNSSQITRFDMNNVGTGSYDTGSWLKVWGFD